MRMIVITLAALCASACASSTTPAGGVASYDSIKQAQAECEAKGGTLVLKPFGNAQWIDAYTCKGK